ncbi:hypothetical protein RB195_026262 [Necator americanus]|uniref:Uncharacterized protein n=1 Tax=Necator americanus TaxID=51031 RepID=A0ABR1EWB9_NECAM
MFSLLFVALLLTAESREILQLETASYDDPAEPTTTDGSTIAETSSSSELSLAPVDSKPVSTVSCQNETSFANLPNLNAFHYTDIYKYYNLGTDNFNAMFLMNALEEIVKYPPKNISDAIERCNQIPLLTKSFDEEHTFRFLAQQALQDSKDTIFEDLVRFKVANTLQFHAVLYLKVVLAKDDLEEKSKGVRPHMLRIAPTFTKFARHLKKAYRLLGRSISRGDVPYWEIEDAIELVTNNNYEITKGLSQTLLMESKWINGKILEYLGKYTDSEQIKDFIGQEKLLAAEQ